MSRVGGISELHKADKEIQEIVKQISSSLVEKLGSSDVKPISYKKQLVNGVNYFVKVKTSSGYVHLRIYKAFGANSNPILVSVQEGKTKDESIEYFN